MSLMLRLLVLVLIAILPAIGIHAYNEFDLRRSREAEIRNQVLQITKQFGEEMGELREGAHQLLRALAQLASMAPREGVDCNALFASLDKQFANYQQLAAADIDGKIFCSSVPERDISVAGMPFFSLAINSDDLAVGNYWADPKTGDKMIHFALRFRDAQGKPQGVVFAALDLRWLSDHLKERGLAPSQSILIADRLGNVIARLPNPDALVGTNMRKSHEALMDGDQAGWEEAAGIDGVMRIFGYIPPQLPPRDFFISAGQEKAQAFASIDRATTRGIALLLTGYVLAAFAAWVGLRIFIQRPIGAVLDAINEWRRGNLAARVPAVAANSELGRLAVAFNTMAEAVARRDTAQKLAEEDLRHLNATLEERVEHRTAELAKANAQLRAEIIERERAKADLVQSQKMEAVGQLTSGIAHDFNNLLTAVLGNIEMAQRRTSDRALLRFLHTAAQAGERGAKLVSDLLTFSRRQQLQIGPVSLDGLLDRIRELLQSSVGPLIRIENRIDRSTWPVWADEGQLELAIINLAINARDAMPNGGVLTIEGTNIGTGDERLPAELTGEFVRLSLQDNGVGMSPEIRSRVFEPFFTTKETGKGSGLGLSIVYGMVSQLGGSVALDSELGEGTTVVIFLPCAAAAPDAARPSALLASRDCGALRGARILVVDDDHGVRGFMTGSLTDAGASVAEAEDGFKALALLAEQDDWHLVIADFAMPGMNGLELSAEIRRVFPSLPILIATGYAGASQECQAAGLPLLKKPFRIPVLYECVRELLVSSRRESMRRRSPAAAQV